MIFFSGPKPYRAIDSCAGIPAGIRLVGIAGKNQKFIFTALQMGREVYIKISISIWAKGNFLAVQPDFGIVINAFKFQNKRLALQIVRDGKYFAIFVIAAFKPTDIAFPKACTDTLLGAHSVVRERNWNGFTFPAQRSARPAGVEIISLHRKSPFF